MAVVTADKAMEKMAMVTVDNGRMAVVTADKRWGGWPGKREPGSQRIRAQSTNGPVHTWSLTQRNHSLRRQLTYMFISKMR